MPPEDPRRRCPGKDGRPCKNWPWCAATAYCRNHDPGLAAQRAANGRVRTAPPPKLHLVEPTPSKGAWREEWTRRRDRERDADAEGRLARIREILESDLPPMSELRVHAIKRLYVMLEDPATEGPCLIGAIRTMLEVTAPKAAGNAPDASGAPPKLPPWMRPAENG
jgi:hypothetical protein